MTIKTLAACVTAAALLTLVSPASAAPTAPEVPGKSAPSTAPALNVKVASQLVVKNSSGVPGETKVLEADLTVKPSGVGIAGKTVVFRVQGKNGSIVPGGVIIAGSALTDGAGKVKLTYALPELAQSNYELKATFAGDPETQSASDDANLLVVKGITKVELGDLIWGTYKNEPGPPYGSIGITLRRTSDGKALDRPLTITVNGHTWHLSPSVYHQIPLASAPTWTVKIQYDGDTIYAASGGQRTYTRPN